MRTLIQVLLLAACVYGIFAAGAPAASPAMRVAAGSTGRR